METLEILDSQDWNKIILKLTAYAIWQCTINHRALPATIEPEDLVMEVIEKVYSGERSWQPQNDPDLLDYLRSVLKSHLANLLRTGRHKHKIEELHNKDSAEYLTLENELFYKQLDERIALEMQGDPGVCLVYKGLKDGLKPLEISKEYAIDIKLIRNAQKRLRTIVLKIVPSKKQNNQIANES